MEGTVRAETYGGGEQDLLQVLPVSLEATSQVYRENQVGGGGTSRP